MAFSTTSVILSQVSGDKSCTQIANPLQDLLLRISKSRGEFQQKQTTFLLETAGIYFFHAFKSSFWWICC